MKIEGNRPNVDPTVTAKLEAARIEANKAKNQGTSVSGDAVTVSPDVALANKAIDTASQSMGVRADAVARGKALLESGKLGSDPQALADSLIQRLLDTQG